MTIGELDLFPATETRQCACAQCGTAFERSVNTPLRKFCSVRCSRKATDIKIKQRAEVTQTFELPPLPLCEKDRDAVDLYKRGFGIKQIGKVQGRNHNAVKKGLIRAGAYKPDPKFNGVRKKGTGRCSRFVIAKQREEKELRRRKNKAAKIEAEKLVRHQIAVCLVGLRNNIPVQTTLKQNGWGSTLWHHIKRRRSYAIIAKGMIRRWPAVFPNNRWSKSFPKEKPFQDLILKEISRIGKTVIREYQIPSTRTRIDFYIPSIGVGIECKVNTKSGNAFECIGQCMHYRGRGIHTIIVAIPSDISFRPDIGNVIKSIAKVETERSINNSLLSIINTNTQYDAYQYDI